MRRAFDDFRRHSHSSGSPRLRIDLDLADETHFHLEAGGTSPDGNQRYLRKDGSEEIYLVPTRQFDVMFVKSTTEWLDGAAGTERAKGRRFTGPEMGGRLLQTITSSDVIVEAVALSDRILVCRQGRIVEEFEGHKADEETIMYAAVH